jgi:hypothetical protein
MTVQELITHLQQLDPNLRIFKDGYEGAYNDINNISTEVEMALYVNSEWYYGDHELVEDLDKEQLEGKTIVKGIIIL